MKSDFAVTIMVLSDLNGNIIQTITRHIFTTYAPIGEDQVTLLTIQSATSFKMYSLILKGDAINILAIQNLKFFKYWNLTSIILDINFFLLSFPNEFQ